MPVVDPGNNSITYCTVGKTHSFEVLVLEVA